MKWEERGKEDEGDESDERKMSACVCEGGGGKEEICSRVLIIYKARSINRTPFRLCVML